MFNSLSHHKLNLRSSVAVHVRQLPKIQPVLVREDFLLHY